MNEFKELRKFAGLTQKMASRKFYVRPQTIRMWEKGATNPNLLLWPIIARTYNINETYLLELCRRNIKANPDLKTISKKLLGKKPGSPTNIPVISWVQAGNGVDRVRPVNGDEFTVVLGGVSDQAFALRIHGDSMKPEFRVGEVIIVDPAVKPRMRKYVVAKIETGNGENRKAIVKQLVCHRDQICLKPFNDKNQPLSIADAEIIGCVVYKIKEY